MTFPGHPGYDKPFIQDFQKRLQSEQIAQTKYDADFATRLARNAQLGPHISPRTLLNVTASNASPDAVRMMQNAAQDLSDQNLYQQEQKGLMSKLFNTLGNVKDAAYDATLKRPIRTLTALGESPWSFINNYVFERDISPVERLTRAGRIMALPTLFSDRDALEAAKYTEFGTLVRNAGIQGTGFQLSKELQYKQLLNVMGFDEEGNPIDYSGRLYWDDAYTSTVVPDEYRQPGEGGVRQFKQPVTLGSFALTLTGKTQITPKGQIIMDKGIHPDSVAGSLISGGIDAIGELATDATVVAGKAVSAVRTLAKGAKIARVSPELARTTKGSNLLSRLYSLGESINDLPSTSRSWAEINALRNAADEDIVALTSGISDPVARQQAIDMRRAVLQDAETRVWDADKLSEMIRTDERWQWIFNMLDSSRTITNIGERAEAIRNKLFRNRIDIDTAYRLANAQTADEYRNVFLEAADTIKQGDQLLPETFTDLTGVRNRLRSKVSQFAPGAPKPLTDINWDRFIMPPNTASGGYIGKFINGKIIDPIGSRVRRMFEYSPDVEIMVDGSAGQRANSVDGFRSFMNSLLPDDLDATFKQQMMGRVNTAMANRPMDIEVLDATGNVVTRTVVAPQTRAGLREVEDMTYEVLTHYMKKKGLTDDKVRVVLDRIKDQRGRARAFAVDDIAQGVDYGQLQQLADDGLVDLDAIAAEITRTTGVPADRNSIAVIGAAMVNELYNHTFALPNWREIRAIVENPMFTQLIRRGGVDKDGQLRFLVDLADTILNRGWKPMNLATIGYVARNILDSQLRLWLLDDPIASAFNRPFQWMRTVANKKAVNDVLGQPMTRDQLLDLAKAGIDELTPSQKNFVSVMRAETWGSYAGMMESIQRSARTGGVKIVTKQSGVAEYTKAVIDALRKINTDPLERIMASVGHLDPDDQVNVIMRYLMDPKNEVGQHVQIQLLAAAEQRGLVVGVTGPMVKTPRSKMLTKLDLSTQQARQDYLRGLIDTAVRGRVERYAQVPELQAMMVQNAIPVVQANGRATVQLVPATKDFFDAVSRRTWGDVADFDTSIGAIYIDPAGDVPYYVVGFRSGPGQVPLAEVIELRTIQGSPGQAQLAWDKRVAGFTPDTRRVIRGLTSEKNPSLADVFPEALISFEYGTVDKLLDGWKNIVDSVFVHGIPIPKTGGKRIPTIGRAEQRFERLPIFRQFKWGEYEKYYDLLSTDELRRAVSIIEREAKAMKMSPNDYMGDMRTLKERIPGPLFKQGRFERLQEMATQAPDGRVGYTLEQLDNVASAVAVRRMRETFYDMPKKFNVEDAAIVSLMYQFIAATRVIGAWWVGSFAKHPLKAYRVARALNGVQDLNLPGDAEIGGIYPHPITDQFVFRHPLGFAGRTAYNLLSGSSRSAGGDVTPILESQVRGLNIGLAGLPQANPVGQLAIGSVLSGIRMLTGPNESYDAVRQLLLPFEELQAEKTITERVLPGWLIKVTNGLKAMTPTQMSAMMTREQNDAASALMATGRYDRTKTEDVIALENDAKRMAVVMVILGGISQFVGPASGNPDYVIKLNGIDTHAAMLAAELQRMKEEDYETATARFIETFGEDALMYVTGKTKTVPEAQGILYTEQYKRWLAGNSSTIAAYESGIGHYFGPVEEEDEFAFAVRSALLDAGKTRYMTPIEKLRASEYAIGATYYRAFREQFPERGLTTEQSDILREYRDYLESRFVGYNKRFTVGAFDTKIADLERIVNDGNFKDSELYNPLLQYLAMRRVLLAESGRTTFRSQAATPFREELARLGDELSVTNPTFARLYDRVLSQETDPVGQ